MTLSVAPRNMLAPLRDQSYVPGWWQGQVVLSGALFASLLMLKHLYLSLAPLYFVYLLRHHCFVRPAPQVRLNK
jgi:hypothetical protein